MNELNDESTLVPEGWEEKRLGELLNYIQPTNYITNNIKPLSNNFGVPVLTANKSFIIGYTTDTNGIFSNVPAIIFDDFTTDRKFVDFNFKVRSSALKVLVLSNSKNSIKFIYEAFNLIKFNAKEHKRYWISEYQHLKIILPPKDEQHKIAAILSAVDEKINIINLQISEAERLKQGLMQRLLTYDAGQVEPNLAKTNRENYLFEDIIAGINYGPRFNAKDYSLSGNVKTIRGTDINRKGDIKYHQVPLALLDEEMVNHHKLQENDLVMITTADCGLTGVFHYQEIPFIPSAYAVRIRLNNKCLPQYFKYFMQSESAKNQVKKFARKGTISNLPASDILKFSISLPSVSEQQKIVNVLTAIDEKIALQGIKKNLFEQFKDGLNQQLLTGKVRVNIYQQQSAVA